jgi:hypothetical protein
MQNQLVNQLFRFPINQHKQNYIYGALQKRRWPGQASHTSGLYGSHKTYQCTPPELENKLKPNQFASRISHELLVDFAGHPSSTAHRSPITFKPPSARDDTLTRACVWIGPAPHAARQQRAPARWPVANRSDGSCNTPVRRVAVDAVMWQTRTNHK